MSATISRKSRMTGSLSAAKHHPVHHGLIICCGVLWRISKKSNYGLDFKSNSFLITTYGSLEVCDGVFLYRDSALCLYFLVFSWFPQTNQNAVLRSPPTNNSARLGLYRNVATRFHRCLVSLLCSCVLWIYKELQVCLTEGGTRCGNADTQSTEVTCSNFS